MEFLKQIRADFYQLDSRDELQIRDPVVFWSKISDQWTRGPLKVEDLNPQATGFTFGFVFDHVAVYLGQDCLFHKPDPTMVSPLTKKYWNR